LIVVKEIEGFGGRRRLSAEDKELQHGRDRVSNRNAATPPLKHKTCQLWEVLAWPTVA
jgi:hypothetical protein